MLVVCRLDDSRPVETGILIQVPSTLNSRYRLHEVIGSGAAGRVYRAHDVHLGRDVAIKRLHEDALGGADERARFEREAIALARISHPHVLPVFDVSTDADDPYLVLNYCPDGSLADRLRRGPLAAAEARELVRQTSAGLAAMHAAGVIHRDVKPSNILRLADRWLISDLGIARVDGQTALTETGARIGTPQYWAPETARGEECTPAVDVYGLGCVLYEALTGQKVFAGGSPLATGLLHATAPPPPLPPEVERADPQLASLVMRMLGKDPDRRPAAATIERQLQADRRLAAEATQRLAPPAAEHTVLVVGGPAATGDRTGGTAELPPPRRRAGLIAIAILLLLGVAGAFALVQSGDETPAASPTTAAPATQAATHAAADVAATTARSVPDLAGQSVAAAIAQLARRDLQLVVSGAVPAASASGLITAQVPAPRTSM
ncbi:MAG: eukaryotic-like serine/threonine-protein kinase, partial [Gaiellaceae bacterium]|nr:eukaryotic-like serine/threonine-protein kinase [Gaiellaceae bacterium]